MSDKKLHPGAITTILKEDFAFVLSDLQKATVHLVEIRASMQKLEAAGMYPSVPNESWQKRERGQTDYLYMTFRKDATGRFLGPQGMRKVYVGADPEKIAQARAMAQRRRDYDQLQADANALERYLAECRSQSQGLRRIAQRWPRAQAELLLTGSQR
ncbi:MAG TPA: hypothetical protein VF719_07200 [Abditibacteriaceae bacterium]|jgi:hypothetical protein